MFQDTAIGDSVVLFYAAMAMWYSTRIHPIECELDPFVIAVVIACQELLPEALVRIKRLEAEKLALEVTKESLHHRLVQAMALSGHALPDLSCGAV